MKTCRETETCVSVDIRLRYNYTSYNGGDKHEAN